MSSDGLKKLESRYEAYALRSGAIVILGLFVEVVLAVEFSHGETFLEIWSPVVADILVALGVFGEIFFARKAKSISEKLQRESDDRVAKATERAADANKLADEARLETERLKAQFAWRLISPIQEQILRHSLEKLKGSSVHILVFMQDAEANNFALDIRSIFKLSGWRVSLTFAGFTGNFAYGLRVPMGSDDTKETSAIIRKAFEDASLDTEPLSIPDPFVESDADENDAVLPWAEIYVGPKLPIFSTP